MSPQTRPDEPTDAPARTVLLLGASNISLGLRPILRCLRGGLEGELNVLVAAGHGRSYADRTITFGRSLPGLLRCGAWSAYANRPEGPPPLVCFTDVGNDLLYDTPPATLVGWVAACFDRLGGSAEVVMTLPPSKRAAALPAWEYHMARGLLFPSLNPLPWDEMRRRADELHDRLSALAESRSVAPLEPPAEWYGFDPIHIRRSRRREAWERLFSGWESFQTNGEATLPRVPVVWGRAEKVRIFGRSRQTPQPVWQGAGISLSLY
ncbi:hypothetical protein [Alienimonas chondri]|uniref:SGNH/GDSL hydrolase family protein n=1 Tax=Alienimonas chondri TaxID=2681879 RepID=A0ABX1V9K0_9PLAN|nr:hypothetical protein [Alienimonas chondri]NNJ23972.1 hypothetical protein [Alienimonas chondri]